MEPATASEDMTSSEDDLMEVAATTEDSVMEEADNDTKPIRTAQEIIAYWESHYDKVCSFILF